MQLKQYSEILNKIKQFEFIVIDKKICDLYPEISLLLTSKIVFVLEYPEDNKNIHDYYGICEFFLSKNITRYDQILAIGGGATSDLAGFVAATILRGIEWSVISTTLLAMIDASIGGKTGINSKLGKNLIGSFHLPKNIWVCPDFLNTLPGKEIQSGLGELLKYAFLSKEIYNFIIGDRYNLNDCILKCAQFKDGIVREDFTESSNRKILNLGHTFGHAFEKSGNLAHGVAVYWGLKFIIDLYLPSYSNTFIKIASILGIKLTFHEKISLDNFMDFLQMDKKKTSGFEVEFILFDDIGKPKVIAKNINVVKTDIQKSSHFLDYFKICNEL